MESFTWAFEKWETEKRFDFFLEAIITYRRWVEKKIRDSVIVQDHHHFDVTENTVTGEYWNRHSFTYDVVGWNLVSISDLVTKDSFIRGAVGIFTIDETIEIAQKCADDKSPLELIDTHPPQSRRTTC